MHPEQKKRIRRIIEHAIGVLAAAIVAGLFTFFQQLASGAGLCPDPAASAEQAGLIGATLKGGHSVLKAKAGTLFL